MGIKIAITGEMRSGKDTVYEMIMDKLKDKPARLFFARGIEVIIHILFPEAWNEGEKPRKLYQDIGHYMRKIDSNVWINYLERRMNSLISTGIEDFIVTDLRKDEEYDWLKEIGFTVIKVHTDPEIRLERIKRSGDNFDMKQLNHETETDIKDMPCDHLIINNTTLVELGDQVDDVLEEIIGEGETK